MRKKEAQAILIGAFLGALSGAALGLLYERRKDQAALAKPLAPGQVVRLGVNVVSLARQFFDLLSR
jgi:hypothetical protein